MTVRKWAVVVGDDVAGTITIDDENTMETAQRFIAAYDSDPRIVPIPEGQEVTHGWSWTGTEFTPPVA